MPSALSDVGPSRRGKMESIEDPSPLPSAMSFGGPSGFGLIGFFFFFAPKRLVFIGAGLEDRVARHFSSPDKRLAFRL